MKLLSDPENHFVLKSHLVSLAEGLLLNVSEVKAKDQFSKTAPFWTLPVLEIAADEEPIFGGNSIATYLAHKQCISLISPDPFIAADAETWIRWEEAELTPALVELGKGGSLDKVQALLVPLEQVLSKEKRNYVSDPDQMLLVDVILWVGLYPLFDSKSSHRAKLAKSLPNIARFFDKLPELYKPFARSLAVFKGTPAGALKGLVDRSKIASDVIKVAPPAPKVAPLPVAAVAGAGAKKGGGKENAASAAGAAGAGGKGKGKEGAQPKAKVPTPPVATAPSCPNVKLASNPPEKCPLPNKKARNVLVTSALPYVNNVPHLGNIIGCVLSADVYARYCRLAGYNTVYVCGTDEYGTATETAALRENCSPAEICTKYHKIHADIYKWFDIGFDTFGRTSTPQQTEVAQEIFRNIEKHDRLVEQETEQAYCSSCERFLADRFVEGTCPSCKYPDARGDQCDGCGKLLNPTDLVEPRCVVCSKFTKVGPGKISKKKSKHLFLDLPKISDELQAFVDKSSKKGNWSNNSVMVTKSWLRDGLKVRCITRDLSWGTPVPRKGYEKKVFYVWFDAPIGYISITACHSKEWKQWWQNPDKVDLVQFMGKDNIPFHTVIFPSSLIASKQPWTMLHHISTTEYLQYEDGKFSKSRGTGVFGDNARETGIPSEVWRYYLLANRPESQDSVFSWADVQAKNNSELLANLGNLCNRGLSFVANNCDGVVPGAGALNDKDKELIAAVNKVVAEYKETLDAVRLRDGLKVCMSASRLGNQYLQDTQPWVLFKNDKPRCDTVLNVAVNLIRLLGVLFEPYMPSFTQKIFAQLNVEAQCLPSEMELTIKAGHKLGNVMPIFRKLEDDEIAGFRAKFGGVQLKDFPLDLKVGKVVGVENHPKADKLFVVKVDMGKGEVRQCVSGIKAFYKPEQLQGKLVIVVTNMKPAKLRDVESQGVILVADTGKEQVFLTTASEGVAPGSAVLPEETSLKAKPNMQYTDVLKIPMVTGDKASVIFDKAHKFVVCGSGVPVVASLPSIGTGVSIK